MAEEGGARKQKPLTFAGRYFVLSTLLPELVNRVAIN
jgi:hypothetical protein